MFPLVFVGTLAVLPAVVFAVPTAPTGGIDQCNVGQLSCCNQVQALSGKPLGARALPFPLWGFNCNPIVVDGTSGNNCAAQAVCCENNAADALANLFYCAPININL